jgi:hypothetical protein
MLGYLFSLPTTAGTPYGKEHTMALRDIVREEWVSLLDEFTRQFSGSTARLEVVGRGGSQQVIAEALPFDGISADLKDGEDSVSVILLAKDGSALNHIVDGVTRMQVDELNGNVARIEIGAEGGTTTVLSLH